MRRAALALLVLLVGCAPATVPLDPLDIPIGHPTIHYGEIR